MARGTPLPTAWSFPLAVSGHPSRKSAGRPWARSGATAAEQMASYTDRTLPLAPTVVSSLAEWVRKVSAP